MCIGTSSILFAQPRSELPSKQLPIENERWEIKGWSLEAGLPQSSVTGIVPSFDGRLWVGSFAGLSRFDGLAFEPLSLTNTNLPIRITHLVKDPLHVGQIWIATEGEGLWLLKDALSADQVSIESVKTPQSLSGATIFDLHAQAGEHRTGIWISTDRGSFHRDPQGHWQQLELIEGQSSSFEMTIDQKGTLWSCTDRALFKAPLHSAQPELLFPPPLSQETEVKQLPACRGGVPYQGGYLGLFEDKFWYISQQNEWTEIKLLKDSQVISAGGKWRQRPWISPQGDLWLLSGIEVFQLGALEDVLNQARQGMAIKATIHPLGYDGRTIYAADKGSFWVGTTGGGLFRISSLNFSQILWPQHKDFSQTGPIAQTSHELWFVKDYQELWRYRDTQKNHYYERVQLPPTHENHLIHAIGARLNGDILIAREQQILSYQRQQKQFKSVFDARKIKELGKISLLSTQHFKSTQSDLDGWWIGTYRGEVLYSQADGTIESLALPKYFQFGKILSLIELSSGDQHDSVKSIHQLDLAIGHARGLSIRRDGFWRNYTVEDGLPRGDIRDLLEIDHKVIWMASYGGGLGWIDQQGHLGKIDVHDAHLSSLKLTADQSLWIQGNKGLTRVKLNDLESLRADKNRPLVTELLRVGEANGWVRQSSVLRKDGSLWLAGVDGLSVTQTTQLMSSTPLRAPQIEAAFVGDFRLQLPHNASSKPIYQNVPTSEFRRLEVQYRTNLLESSRSIGYEHRLIRESDSDNLPWIPAGTSKLLTYTHLNPGHYRLQVRSVSLEYAPSELTELRFMIPWQWHELLWVRILLGFILITIPTFASLWRARLISLHNRRLRLEIEEKIIAKQRLKDREARYRKVFNEAKNAFLFYTSDGICVEVNQQALYLFNTSQETLMNTSPRDLGLPPLEHWIEVKESSEVPLLCFRLDGSVFPARMNYVPYVADGLEMWLVSIVDLSSIVSAHEQQTWLLHQRSIIRRMDALGRLSSGIVHDLNNILGALSGNIELMKDELSLDEFMEESLDDMIECLKRGSILSQQLLAFSRLKTTQTRSVLHPVELVKGLEKLLYRLMPQGVSLVLDLNFTGQVKLDQGIFEQVLLTLTLHAAEASPIGGEVWISLKESQEGSLQLRVDDEGPPIPLKTLSTLLESDQFKEDDLSPALAQVHHWVSQAHGQLSITRREQKNQVMIDWKSPDTTPIPSQKKHREMDQNQASYQVVVVDDNQELRRVLVRQLKSLGHTVESYGDPLEALELIRQGIMPDILISDVIMPGLNGRQLTSELRKTFPNLKVIFISGYTSDVLGEVSMHSNQELLLYKPFTKEVLQRKINELMN